MPDSNLALCFEGIQRVYRNAIVGCIRSVFIETFPNDYLEKLRKPFKNEEWERIRENAAQSRTSGELTAPVLDDFDLLSVSHFFNLFDVYYDVLCRPLNESKGSKNADKQALLGWIRTIKNLRDPMSHPSEEDFGFEDSFLLLDSSRRVLLRLGLENDGARIKAIMGRLTGAPLSVGSETEPLEDRLPPRESIVVDFVGRQIEIDRLWDWFRDPVSRRWALSGEGGKGKSALAYKFATEVKFTAPEPFQAVLWLSAKKRRFEEGKVVDIAEPDFCDLDSALSRLLLHYGWTEELEKPTESKRAKVIELLDSFPALVVVDDIDSLESQDEDVIEFFSLHVPQTKSKILFTSRRTLFGMGGTTTHVSGLDAQDGDRFIASRCQLMELDPALFTGSIVGEIMKVTEGSPLYIEDVIRLTSIITPKEAIRHWREKGGDLARRYALGREWDLLSNEAREVLIAACIGPPAVSVPELEAITGFTSEILTTALRELQRLFLVPKARLIEGEQRFELNVNTRALVKEVERASEVYRRIENAYKAISGRLPKVRRGDIGAVIRQAVFLVRNNDQPSAESLLQKALQKYSNDPYLIGFLGWVYKTWHPPRLTDARQNFYRAWQLGSADEEMYKHWCRMEIEEDEWTSAADAALKGLQRLPSNGLLLYFAGYAKGRLARELIAGLHLEKATKELEAAVELLKQALKAPDDLGSGHRALNADIYRALVLAFEQLRDGKKVRDYCELWQAEHPDDPNASSEGRRLSEKFCFGS